jgi:type I restriction enzyme M protein
LISAYKHILRANTDARGNSTLTPDDKGRLARNFKGYDISPDMVRLSLVNLYLHGFTDPHIDEYDALTSEEKWNEFADVILANPPFMSPKGGIKPHKRFSVQSKRSEVLFVDYMAEHLAPGGRAGIIVPEGIIFQGQNAYKQLRQMLVEKYLVAVVSLPAGVFNPYSGVKTSILILDKTLARQSDTIAFFKVENDGFGLGAQRREINKNDLPQVIAELAKYLGRLRARESIEELQPTLGLIVEKEKISENGDYNLSGGRYREEAVQFSNFPWREVGSLVETITPPSKIQKTAFGVAGRFPIIDQSQEDIAGWTDDESALIYPSKPLVIFGDHTCVVKLIETPFAQGADGIKILQTIDTLDPLFLFHVLRAKPLESDGYKRHFSKLKEHQIPLPPLGLQKEIVAEIEGYQKVIDGAHAVIDNYRPHISIHQDWPMVELGEVCKIKGGYAFKSSDFVKNGIQLIRMGNVKRMLFDHQNSPVMLPNSFKNDYQNYVLNKGAILISMTGTIGKEDYGNVCMIDIEGDFLLNQRVGKFVIETSKLNQSFIYYIAQSAQFRSSLFSKSSGGVRQANISNKSIEKVKIPLPPLASQQAIVTEIKAEQALVAANRELIARFEKKIQATLARVWGEGDMP